MSVSQRQLTEDFRDFEIAHGYLEEFQNIYIASQIRALRKQRGWTQQELGERADMRQERIATMENVNYGSWSITTLRKLAEAFDVGLRVSFETVGTMIDDVLNMGEKNLQRISRSEELSSRTQPTFEMVASTGLSQIISEGVRTSYGKEDNSDPLRKIRPEQSTPVQSLGYGGNTNDLRQSYGP